MENQNCNAVTDTNSEGDNAFTKTIGKATYNVRVYFSQCSKENFNDKLLRIINNDIVDGLIEGSDVN